MNPKLSISTRLIALGLSSLFALSGQVMAATTDWGAQTAPASLNFGATFFVPQQQFYDDYMFSIPSASVNSISSTISLGSFWGINNLQARLYNGTVTTTGKPDGLLQAWSTAIPISMAGVSGTVAVINPITLASGNYILEVRGDVAGTFGGSYAGILNISPVPEPGEWVLMLSGLGLIGFIAARRKRNAGVAAA
ncbi:MAG: FxDxF family PEP-CTERM protein [Sulfuricella sp.]|nr:FxDxF family PEP-CTERM protein [Gammaproteobacteria bacterium]